MIDKALQIKGWMSPMELEWLAERAKESELIVEFGSYQGRSTRALGDNTKGVVYAVDTWSTDYPDKDGKMTGIVSDNSYSTFCNNVNDLLQLHRVIPIIQNSREFELFDKKADMFFLDGDHRYEVVIDDIKTALKYLKPGGIISGHDYGHPDWPGVQRAVLEMIPKFEVCGSIWWTRI